MRILSLYAILVFLFPLFPAAAQEAGGAGYRIEVDLDNFDGEEVYLAYYFGDKQYIKDTTRRTDAGSFVFQREEPLPGGIYLVVLPPDNNFFQLLVDENEQRISISADAGQPVASMQVSQGADNADFYDYLRYLESRRPEAGEVQEKMGQLEAGSPEYKELQGRLEAINDEVYAYQREYVEQHQGSLSAALIEANFALDVPEFETDDPQELQVKRWRWTQKHYFDHIDLTDERLLRSPILFDRVNTYVNKLQVQHPDTMARAIDGVLAQMEPAPESFKFFLIHFLNEAAKSKIVGMDALYVHLVNKYYATGKAEWTDKDQLDKIIDNARSLEPLLIGKTAPDVTLQTREGKKISLHEIDAEYTIFYIWRYDCGVCKKSTPDMKAFYEEFKDRGVKIFAACFKFGDEVAGCWDYIEENGIGDWIHVVDPLNQSRYSDAYYVKSTPQLYILDKDKKILSKRIGADQLAEVMETIMEVDAREKEDQAGEKP